MTIPAGALGTFGATGPLPGKDVKIQESKQDFEITQTTVAQPVYAGVQDSLRRQRGASRGPHGAQRS